MSTQARAHSRQSSLGGGPSMIGMIRARKIAVKIKKRAKFLVAERCRRDNTGKSATVHRDFPKLLRPDVHDSRFLHQTNFLTLTPSSRSPSVASKYHTSLQSRFTPNTYRLQPVNRFSVPKVKEVIEEVLIEHLRGKKYEASFCKETSKKTSEIIKQRVKFLGFSRYKFICVVYIGQYRNQGMRIASRCLWDQANDSVAEGYFRNGNLYAIATVYGFYCE